MDYTRDNKDLAYQTQQNSGSKCFLISILYVSEFNSPIKSQILQNTFKKTMIQRYIFYKIFTFDAKIQLG